MSERDRMAWRPSEILKPKCPECRDKSAVYVFDRGAKRLWRMVVGNNRFACASCRISWRRRTPYDSAELVRKHEDTALRE